MKKDNIMINWTLSLALSLTIISSAVLFSLHFKGLYYWDIQHLSIASDANMGEEQIRDNYNVLIDYLTDKEQKELVLPSFGMSTEGRIHFEDVKEIFMFLQKAVYVLGAYSLFGILISIAKKSYVFLKYTVIVTIGLPLTIFTLAMINFDKVFIIFHQLVFRNDYWIFDPTKDPVITILPQEFFMHSFFLIIGIVILVAFVLIFMYSLINGNKK